MYKYILILVFSLLLISCGNSEDELENAILRANVALTNGNCSKAISVLEEEGNQPTNAEYIKILATAYACKAGYKTTILFTEDLSKVSDPQYLLKNLSTFTTSNMESVDSASFVYLEKALNILLYAGENDSSINPTADYRSEYFGSKGTDINTLAFYLALAQLGNFSYYFGNADEDTGEKGAGNTTSINPCYLDYSADVNTFIAGLGGSTGSCGSGDDLGHPDLVDDIDTVNIENACRGITLFNNFLDNFNSFIGVFAGDDFEEFGGIKTIVNVLEVGISTVKPSFDTRIFDTTSQERCESILEGNDEDIMYFYAAIFETLHT